GVHHPELALGSATASRPRDSFAVRGPRREDVVDLVIGELDRVRSVGLHHPDVALAAAIALEDDRAVDAPGAGGRCERRKQAEGGGEEYGSRWIGMGFAPGMLAHGGLLGRRDGWADVVSRGPHRGRAVRPRVRRCAGAVLRWGGPNPRWAAA